MWVNPQSKGKNVFISKKWSNKKKHTIESWKARAL